MCDKDHARCQPPDGEQRQALFLPPEERTVCGTRFSEKGKLLHWWGPVCRPPVKTRMSSPAQVRSERTGPQLPSRVLSSFIHFDII